jgi:hypothetical protein
MRRATIAETRVLQSWQAYQEALRCAITPLTEEQMNRRLAPDLRSAGEIAEHIVYGRALWLHHVLGEGAAEVEPMLCWDHVDDPPRTVAEVVRGLGLTWRMITTFLTRGSAADEIPNEEAEKLQIVWGLLDHDLPHAGELSLVLGAYGLPGVEI